MLGSPENLGIAPAENIGDTPMRRRLFAVEQPGFGKKGDARANPGDIGAARVALGPDLPAVFANRDDVVDALLDAARAQHDPVWRLPLWQPYRAMLVSSVADTCNTGASRHAGAITAALYLQNFVPASVSWLHVDVYAWNDVDRAGRPRGGEAQSLRAFHAFLKRRYPRA